MFSTMLNRLILSAGRSASIIVLSSVAFFVGKRLRSRKERSLTVDDDLAAEGIDPMISPFSGVRSGPIVDMGRDDDALRSELEVLMMQAVETRVERRARMERLERKLRSKFRSGEIDRELYEELNRYLDSDMEE